MQGPDCKIAGDAPVCNAGHHAAVMEVYDGAVIADIPVFQEQICEIRAPFLVGFLSSEVLFQLVFKYFVGFPGFVPGFLGRTIECRPNSLFIYLWTVVRL